MTAVNDRNLHVYGRISRRFTPGAKTNLLSDPRASASRINPPSLPLSVLKFLNFNTYCSCCC